MFCPMLKTVLSVAIVFLHLNQCDAKDHFGRKIANNTKIGSSSESRFSDLDSVLYNMFPNLNGGIGYYGDVRDRPGNFQNYPDDDGNPGNYPQYPDTGSNYNSNNNWNNNRYPGNHLTGPSYLNVQNPGSSTEENRNVRVFQNNHGPSAIMFPGNQIQTQGFPQGQAFDEPPNENPDLNQGQPQYLQGAIQNYKPGFHNSGSFNNQDSNGLSNQLPNANLQNPLLHYPPNEPDITTRTTEKVAISGMPVIMSNVPYFISTTPKSTSAAVTQCIQDCQSTSEYNPVCGSNNVTYFNDGKIECARICGIDVTVRRRGTCTIVPAPGVYA